MQEGDLVLASLPQADDASKPRPGVLLREMPGFGDFLVCGVSTRLHHYIEGFDELILSSHEDFATSGLLEDSVIRLSFLALIPRSRLAGTIGRISAQRHRRLLVKLSTYLVDSDSR